MMTDIGNMVGQVSGHFACNFAALKGPQVSDRSVISMKLLLLHSFCFSPGKHFMVSSLLGLQLAADHRFFFLNTVMSHSGLFSSSNFISSFIL